MGQITFLGEQYGYPDNWMHRYIFIVHQIEEQSDTHEMLRMY